MVGPEGLQEASTLPKLRVVPLKIAEQGSTFPRGLAACKTLASKSYESIIEARSYMRSFTPSGGWLGCVRHH